MMCHLIVWALLAISNVAGAQGLTGELAVRGGLANTDRELKRPAKDSFRVAFFGGSITEAANGWRDGTVQWLQKQTARPVHSINAAIGGTGSSLGVYRLRKDVLVHRPHLLFVEFAVNDGKDSRESILKSMEGIVRQTWRTLPQTDICFVYTVSSTMAPDYAGGNLPTSVRAMQDLANYYNIPAVNFAPKIMDRVRSGALFFAGKQPVSGDSTFFSPDGVHPYPATGYRLYNETVQAALPQLLNKGKKRCPYSAKAIFQR
jgi:lysophospholipase L1-like esterase